MRQTTNRVRGGERALLGGRRGELTERDLEISRWLDRLIGAGLDQIRIRFGLGQSQAYRRLQVLRRAGIVQTQRLLANRPSLYMLAGRSLRPASYEHALRLAQLIAARESVGLQIITEVELRRERAGEHGLPTWVNHEQRDIALRCRRIPDAIEALPGGGLRAIEIELSSKGRARREAILGNYAASKYEQVT